MQMQVNKKIAGWTLLLLGKKKKTPHFQLHCAVTTMMI